MGRGINAQNKANFEERTSRGRGPIMGNRAKLAQDGTSGRRGLREGNRAKRTQFGPAGKNRWGKPHPTRGSIAPNKANSRHGVRRGKGLAGKELWLIAHSMDLGKTKPNLGELGHLGDGASGRQSCETKPIPGGAGRGEARGALGQGAKCAKQTQFAGSPRAAAGTFACELRRKTYNQATLWRTDND